MNNVQIENFGFFAGDHKLWPMYFTDGGNNKMALNNRRFVFTVKQDIDDADDKAIIKKVYDITGDEPVYTFQLNLTTEDTKNLEGRFEYDLRISFISNPTEIQMTVLRGTLNIEKPVTQIMGE